MRMTRLLFLIIVFFLIHDILASQKNEFNYFSPLKPTQPSGNIGRVVLPYKVLSHCESPNLNDLRLFATDGNEIPFAIIDSRAFQQIKSFYFNFLSYEENDEISEIIVKSASDKFFNKIDFIIPGKNFKKSISIFKSKDKNSWEKILDGELFDYSYRIPLRKTEFFLPQMQKTNFLKIVLKTVKSESKDTIINLSNNNLNFSYHDKDQEKFKIQAIRGVFTPAREENSLFDFHEIYEISQELDKQGNTIINLPKLNFTLNKIHLQTSQKNYMRKVEVFEKTKKKHKLLLKDDSIYSIPELNQQKEHISLNISSKFQIQLKIINGDNPPLKIEKLTLKWKKKNLFFFPENNGGFVLYFGNKNIKKPEYEVSKMLNPSKKDIFNYPLFEVRALQINKQYNPKINQSTKEIIEKSIFSLIILLLTSGIGCWLYSLVKNMHSESS